jgi:hypothetical protein
LSYNTIQDTLAWDKTRLAETELRAGLKYEKEQKVLQMWKEERSH